MNASQIRAVAIERLARCTHKHNATLAGERIMSWDELEESERRAYLDQEEAWADALGDLLPTGAETKELPDGFTMVGGFADGDRTVVVPATRMRRYVTGWGKGDA